MLGIGKRFLFCLNKRLTRKEQVSPFQKKISTTTIKNDEKYHHEFVTCYVVC